MDNLIPLLEKCEIATILAIFFGFWIFNGLMNKKFEKIDAKFEKVDARFDKIEADIKEMRTSLNRMEGAFYSKECCMLKSNEDKKAL